MRKLSLLLLGLVLALAGCAGKPDTAPDWVSGNSEQYPAGHYLLGRGQAEQASVARDRARADVAKVFQVKIDEQTADIQQYTSSGSGVADASTFDSSVWRHIHTRTEQTLSHIDVVELWQNPVSHQYHALAVVDRLKAGQALRGEIQELDSLTSAAITAAQQQDDLLARLADADRALQAQLQRRALQRQLAVIDITGLGVRPQHDLGKLTQDREALLQRLTLQVETRGDAAENLHSIVAGAVARAGFTPGNNQADYRLEASLQLSPFNDQQWHWYIGTLQVTLIQLPGGENRGTHRWDIKQAASQPALAQKRVLDELDRTLQNELREVIAGFGKAN